MDIVLLILAYQKLIMFVVLVCLLGCFLMESALRIVLMDFIKLQALVSHALHNALLVQDFTIVQNVQVLLIYLEEIVLKNAQLEHLEMMFLANPVILHAFPVTKLMNVWNVYQELISKMVIAMKLVKWTIMKMTLFQNVGLAQKIVFLVQ